MFGLQISTFAFIAVCTMAAVVGGMASGFFIGRFHALSNEPKKLREDRERTLQALLNLMQSTEQLNSEVDVHNNELVSAKQDIVEMECDTEIKCLQTKLLNNISRVVESNRRMENDLIVSRYQLENQAQELDRTRREARADALCNEIGNRKAFDETMRFMISRLSNSDQPFGLLLVDVDYFKRINDTFGHNAGDEVLVSIGTALKECVRPEDIVCRIGGDEFAVLLDGINDENAKLVGKRIRETIEHYDFCVGESGQSTVVTLSMGLAVAKQDYSSEQIYEAADQALYKSKRQGRNRLTVKSEAIESAAAAEKPPADVATTNTYEEFKASLNVESV